MSAAGCFALSGIGLILGLGHPLPAQGAGKVPTPPANAADSTASASRGAAAQKGFQTLLWWRDSRPATPEFFAAVRRAGYSGVSVGRAQDAAAVRAAGLSFYGDQICGKGILEQRHADADRVAAAYAESRDEADLIRPAVLSDSATLLSISQRTQSALARILPHNPLAVSLADEASVTRHASPLDVCFAPASLRAFRQFMRARYRKIALLNASWGTDFPDFQRVRPFTADRIRARELGTARYPANLSPWAAHREFMDIEFARLIRRVKEQVGRADPSLPVGLTGMQQPSAYGGHDYGRLMPEMSFYEVYDIGGSRDLAMSLAPPGARQFATLFPLKAGEDPRLVTARIADMLAHGMWGTVVWSSREVMGGAGEPTRFGAAITRALRLLKGPRAAFAGARMRRSPVWLVESQPSVRAWWMLDSRRDGDTWIKRLSSYERNHSTSLAARHSWIRLLEDLGLQPLVVPAKDLPARLVASPPRLLVLPATLALSDAEAEAIRGYVERGGFVVADHTPGFYDHRLRRRGAGALDGLFGVEGRSMDLGRLLVLEGKPLDRARLRTGPAAAEAGIKASVADPVSGFHVQLERRQGLGRAIYLNLAVCEYAAVRLDPSRLTTAIGLRRRVRYVLREAQVVPPVLVECNGMPTALERTVLRTANGRRLLAIRVNALESPEILKALGSRTTYTARLTFPRPTRCFDLVKGSETPAAVQHELSFDPFLGLFLELKAP